MDQYVVNERLALEWISGSEGAIPDLVSAGNYYWAANNYRIIAERQAELGLLHWRRGLDARPDFERAMDAYEDLRAMAQAQGLKRSDYELPLVYAMLSLMGRKVAIEFEDEEAHEEYRLLCYQSCLVHALHDQPLNERHTRLLNQYLAEDHELADRSFLTYFQLLGVRSTGQSPAELVKLAEANWLKRKSDAFFSGGPSFDGHGVMNELYVDIYLAAVLKKIGWCGESVHRWKWET